jgi:hypothetical protein
LSLGVLGVTVVLRFLWPLGGLSLGVLGVTVVLGLLRLLFFGVS